MVRVDQLNKFEVLLETGANDQGWRIGIHNECAAWRGWSIRSRPFTGCQPENGSIGDGMVADWTGRTRALSLGLMAAALAACASVPAPVAGRGTIASGLPSIPNEFGEGPRVADSDARLQCVPFAREASGIAIYGDANTWWRQASGRYPRSHSPAPGSVLVLRGYNDPGRGHVAVVRAIESSRVIFVDHANWLNGGEISVNVPVLDVSLNNDWSEVRVWHIPSAQWGARIYQAEGFIHPFTLQAALS